MITGNGGPLGKNFFKVVYNNLFFAMKEYHLGSAYTYDKEKELMRSCQ